jgi:hypothetical protein
MDINKNENENETFDSTTVFPSTIILSITSHGKITIDNNDNPQTFIIPEGIKIITSLLSTIGECNILNENTINNHIKIIEQNMEHLLDPETQIDTVTNVTDEIRHIDSENLSDKVSNIKDLRKKKLDEMDFADYQELTTYEGYVHGFDKSHIVDIKNPGGSVLNKSYNREGEEATTNDWVIKILNMSGQPDILTYISNLKSDGTSTITFEDIVMFFSSKMVDTLIVFDFSCSDILDKDGMMYVPPRKTRQIRRPLYDVDPDTKRVKLKETFGGKRTKTKRRIKRTKSKRRLKRTKSKRTVNK